MNDRRTWVTVLNVLVYSVGAVIVFAWLAVRASNGGLFTEAYRTYVTVVPSAPGVESNKTEVLSASGVPIGVVTGVEPSDDGVQVDLKLTKEVDFNKDASTRVVIRNIVGERAVMIEPGTSKTALSANATQIPYRDVGDVIEPSDALSPVAELQGLRNNPEIRALIDEQEAVIAESSVDVEKILTDGRQLASTLALQQEALAAVGRRTDELVEVMASKGADINTLLAQMASLAQSANGLLEDNFTVLEAGLDLSIDTVELISRRRNELDFTLTRLPEIANDLEHMSGVLVKLLNNEKGAYVYLAVPNMPTIDALLAALRGEA
ncbi:MAG: hypothetical protein IT198_00050 [Acidimicrobiia bacterium]|nr:hypothetical protein [Acidimicrobiia bacterium]